MTRSTRAVFENGVLRPLEPLPFRDRQEVTVTVTDRADEEWPDVDFLSHFEADDAVTLEQVRAALATISGPMTADFRRERDDRF